VSADVVSHGLPIPKIERLRIMSPAQWEDFALEWAHSLKLKYREVEKCGGAGDMGRDVVAYVLGDDPCVWDNFQCKHYDHPLMPSDIWVELGKLCYYSQQGAYSIPRQYRFVAPHGGGNKLSNLLRDPHGLRNGLIENWDEKCKSRITTTVEVPLTPELLAHVESIDFSIFGIASPLTLIEDHSGTPWHAARFGGGLPPRPPNPSPPLSPAAIEGIFVRALLDAYEDRLQFPIATMLDLSDTALLAHLKRSRTEFYCAEALREFSKDNVPIGTFDALLDEVENGVADIIEAAHPDAFERVLAVVRQAKSLSLTANALMTRISTPDRGGMCHQLANQEKLKWRP
jgi:hypothetical protein